MCGCGRWSCRGRSARRRRRARRVGWRLLRRRNVVDRRSRAWSSVGWIRLEIVHEPGLFLDSSQPCADRGELLKVETGVRRGMRVGVERDVGDRVPLDYDEGTLGEMRVEHRERGEPELPALLCL